LIVFIGTAKAMPCYKAVLNRVFPQHLKAQLAGTVFRGVKPPAPSGPLLPPESPIYNRSISTIQNSAFPLKEIIQ